MSGIDLSIIGVSAFQGTIIGVVTRVIVDITVQLVKWIMLGEFVFLKFLESRDIIVVDWEKLTLGIVEVSHELGVQTSSILVTILETGSFGVGFFAGYALKGRVNLSSLKI